MLFGGGGERDSRAFFFLFFLLCPMERLEGEVENVTR